MATKITEDTISYLKNFSEINEGIVIKKGNILQTIAPQKNIFASVEVQEDFPRDFCIYNLPSFLSVLSLYESPEVDFQDKQLVIKGKNSKTTYRYADPSTVIAPPEGKKLSLDSADVSLKVKADDIKTILRFADVLQAPNIVISRRAGGAFQLTAVDLANDSSNSHTLDLTDEANSSDVENFVVIFKRENLKIINGDYDVSISKEKPMVKFENKAKNLQYFISLEKGGKFN